MKHEQRYLIKSKKRKRGRKGILGIEEKRGELVVKNLHVYGCGKPLSSLSFAFTPNSVIRLRGREGFTRDSHYYDHSSLLPKNRCLCLHFFHFSPSTHLKLFSVSSSFSSSSFPHYSFPNFSILFIFLRFLL